MTVTLVRYNNDDDNDDKDGPMTLFQYENDDDNKGGPKTVLPSSTWKAQARGEGHLHRIKVDHSLLSSTVSMCLPYCHCSFQRASLSILK